MMVLLTGIYVIATIAICIANWKTIKEMREDRRINSAILLYHDREKVLEQFAKHDFDSIACKIPMLFGMDYYLRMDDISYKEKQTLNAEGKEKLDLEFRKLFSDMAEYTKQSITQ